MNEAQIIKSYEIARERYAELGIDTDKALETLQSADFTALLADRRCAGIRIGRRTHRWHSG